MATTSPTETEFGEVSRIKGIVFKYISFAASIVGILALGVLLAYVFWDALGLESAGTSWYLAYTATLLVPLLAFFVYARTRPAVVAGTFELFSMTLAGVLLTGAGVIILSIIASPGVWFTYFLTVVGPIVGLYVYGQYDRKATWVGLAMLVVLLVGPVVGTLGMSVLTTIGALLGSPGIYFLSLVVPAAAVAAYLSAERLDFSRRRSIGIGVGLPVLAIAAVPLVDTVPAISRSVWLIGLVLFGLPVGFAVANTARIRDRWPAFAFPAIIALGFLAGEAVVSAIGATPPTPWLDWQYVTSGPSQTAAEAGLYPAIIGSIFLIVLVSVFTFVFGVGAAIYLEEYAPGSGPLAAVTRIIKVNISNLAGVPSVVYGLLGLGIFVNIESQLGPFTYAGFGVGTVLTAAMTLSLLILPIVIISAQEAIRSVPDSLRQASYGMGATRWQTIRNVVLPRSLPGILTGTILALGRAIGETAPLIMVGAATTKFSPPSGLFGKLTAMPMQIFAWAFEPSDEFRYGVVAAGVVTLLIVMLTMNSVAILVRNKYQQEAN
ncbi:phosphate ABC transporter permease PstA [Haloarcula rubripromontorii]|uniref:Phosphate transport system permease protein PstA n=1 Tax=Haloarcula rubripromontorii TaxID=1705562 RepID=A0A847U3G6_9EURY|nr:phosphate ABC transporter permease PstA [Haloarcula rubripromontorii]NLV06030.1 phosphate ABC transporter permease PstA [Haloarcula rubripromontorii]